MFNQHAGYHALLFANQTAMPYEVAVTACQRSLGCSRFSREALDAIRNFRRTYTDQAPEQVP